MCKPKQVDIIVRSIMCMLRPVENLQVTGGGG